MLKNLCFFYDSQDSSFLRPRGSKRVQDVPKTPVDGPSEGFKGVPKWILEGPMRAQDRPKRVPKRPKMAPRGLQEGPSWL